MISRPVHLEVGTPRRRARRTVTLEPEETGEPDQAEQDDGQQQPPVAPEEPEDAARDRAGGRPGAPRTVRRHDIRLPIISCSNVEDRSRLRFARPTPE